MASFCLFCKASKNNDGSYACQSCSLDIIEKHKNTDLDRWYRELHRKYRTLVNCVVEGELQWNSVKFPKFLFDLDEKMTTYGYGSVELESFSFLLN